MQNIKSICFVILLIITKLFVTSGAAKANYQPLDSTQISEVIHSSTRNVISLQGTWERSMDEKNWERVTVPFTDYEEDRVLYRKKISIDSQFAKTKNLRLFFLGLAGQVEIYFNGEFVTIVDGKFLPADIIIPTKIVYAGENEIKLVFQRNSGNDVKQHLSIMNAPKFIKGIIREPFLIGTSQVYISELKYRLSNNLDNLSADLTVIAGQITEQIIGKDEITGTLSTSSKMRLIAEYRIINKRTNEAVTSTERREFFIENLRTANLKFSISINHLNKWLTHSPEVYKLEVKLKYNENTIDDCFVNFGKITINIKDNLFYENDKPIEIKAFTYNDHYGTMGTTLSVYRMEEDIKIIKFFGANAIRVQHNFPHPYFIFLCEKYGLLLMLDLPLANTNKGLLDNEEFIIQHKNMVTRFFQSYSNSTAFFALGVGSSAIEGNEFAKFANQLIALSKKFNKLIYKVVELGVNIENVNTSGYNFLCFKTNDANSQAEKISEELGKIKRKYSSSPILLTFTTRVEPGNLYGYSNPTSTEYQAYFFKNCYNLVSKEQLAGCLINSFNDYATHFPVLTLRYHNQYLVTDGIYDTYRNDRLAATVLKALFNDERVPLLNAGNYANEIPIIYVILGLVVLLILFIMINRYSRFREYFIRAFLRPYNFFADIRDQRIMSIVQTLILGIIIAISLSICFGSVIFNIRNDINYSYLVTALFPFGVVLDILFRSAWQPELLLGVFSLFFSVLLYICALLLRLLAKILRAKLFIDNTITIIVWSALPFVLLLPVGIMLSKLIIISQFFMYLFFGFLIFLCIWFILRVFKAVAIIFDKSYLQVYPIGFLFLVLILVIPILYYESHLGLFPFIEYFLFLP